MVRIVAVDSGQELGRGLAGYSSPDLERIQGCQSEEIEALLGYKYFDEAVHRDNLVVLEE